MHHNHFILVCGNDGLVTYFLIVPASTIASDHTSYLGYGWSSVPSSASAYLPAWCSFYGVTCDTNAGSATLYSVIYIQLKNLLLAGSLPSSIGSLTSLKYLNLFANKLTGTIPSSIGSLLSLTYTSLSYNSLIGTIPSSIGLISSVEEFFAHNNQLTGTIPSSVGLMSSLQVLSLYSNKLTGTIPSTFSQLSNLNDLELAANYLTMGSATSVPESTFSAFTLSTFLDISYNCLTFRGSVGTNCKPISSKLCNQIY